MTHYYLSFDRDHTGRLEAVLMGVASRDEADETAAADLADLTTHGNPAEHPRFLVADHGDRVEVTQYPDAKENG